jgi:hypothetical protein
MKKITSHTVTQIFNTVKVGREACMAICQIKPECQAMSFHWLSKFNEASQRVGFRPDHDAITYEKTFCKKGSHDEQVDLEKVKNTIPQCTAIMYWARG